MMSLYECKIGYGRKRNKRKKRKNSGENWNKYRKNLPLATLDMIEVVIVSNHMTIRAKDKVTLIEVALMVSDKNKLTHY